MDLKTGLTSIKTLGLAALTALAALALLAAPSAMAESTQLCSTDPATSCTAVTHVHETSVTNALLLNSLGNVKCAVLFLSTSVGASASPQVIKGNLTYSSCLRKKILGGEEACTVTEINGPTELKVLKEGHETASVTGEGEVEVKCGSVIKCVYNGENLKATAKGALLSTQANGEVTISEQEVHKVSGSLCPSTAKLDITTTPLSAIYIGVGLSATTSLSTSLKGGGKEGAEISVAEGSKVKDTATLSGENASKATGTITYKVYKDKECKELVTEAGKVTVKEGKVPDSEEKELEAGKEYFWLAEYGGDEMNGKSTSSCSKEVLKVKANTSISTELSGGGKEGAIVIVPESTKVKDQATLSGTNVSGATGTVDYAAYEDEECKELASEAGKGKVEGSKVASSEEKELKAGAIYYWQAEYLGDSLHEKAKGACGAEIEIVHPPTTLCNAEPEETEGNLYCPKGKGFSGDIEGELEPKTVATFESTEEPKEVISCSSSQIDGAFNEDGTSPESGGITSLSFSGEGGSPCSVTGGETSEVEIEVEEGLPLNGTTLSYQQPPANPLILVLGLDGGRIQIAVIRGFLNNCTYSPVKRIISGDFINGDAGPPPTPSRVAFVNQLFERDHVFCNPQFLNFSGNFLVSPSPPIAGVARIQRPR